jgi:hypothetical protein
MHQIVQFERKVSKRPHAIAHVCTGVRAALVWLSCDFITGLHGGLILAILGPPLAILEMEMHTCVHLEQFWLTFVSHL